MKKLLTVMLSALLLLTASQAEFFQAGAEVLASDTVLAEERFDGAGFALNQAYTKVEMDTKNSAFSYGSGGGAALYTPKEHNGVRYLEMARPAVYTGTGASTVNLSPVSAGSLVVEMKILPDTASLSRSYFVIIGEKGQYRTLGSNTGANFIYALNGNVVGGTMGTPLEVQPVTGLDGFCSLRTVISRQTASNNWNVYVYDQISGKKILSAQNIARDIGAVTKISLVDTWNDSAASAAAVVNIAAVKIYIPEKIGITEAETYDSDTKTVSFTVTEPLDTATVSTETVKVTSPSGAVVDVTPVYEGDKLTLSFVDGLPEEGSYTVSFSGVISKRNIPVTIDGLSFYGVKTVIPFKVRSVTPGEGTIHVNAGKITISFTDNVDPSTVDGIRFTDGEGNPIVGFCNKSVDKNEVKFTFGKLNPGVYIVTVDETVQSAEGKPLGETLQYHFEAIETAILYEDYQSEDYAAGSKYTAAALHNLNPALTYGASGVYTIEQSGNLKYLTVNAKEVNSGASVRTTLPKACTVGSVELCIKIKASTGKFARNIFRLVSSDSNLGVLYTLQMKSGNLITLSENSNAISGKMGDAVPLADEEGFYNLYFRIFRTSEEEDWSCELYDSLSESELPFYTATAPKEKLPDVSQFILMDSWAVAASETAETISLTEIELWSFGLPEVISSNCSKCVPTVENLSFVFDDNLNEEKLKPVLSKTEDGAEIAIEAAYLAQERRLELTLRSYLKYDTEYKLALGGAAKDIVFTTAQAPLSVTSRSIAYQDASGQSLTEPAEGCKSNCTITFGNARGTEKVILLIFAAYDQNGRIKKITEKMETKIGYTFQMSMELSELTAGDSVSCFAWEKVGAALHKISVN